MKKKDVEILMATFAKGIAGISKTSTSGVRKTASGGVEVIDENLSITKYIRGVTGLGWHNAEAEEKIFKALGQDNAAAGGVFVPTTLSSEIIELLKETAAVRSMPGVQVVDVPGDKMEWVSVTDPPVISWGSEAGTITEDTGLQFGKKTLELKKAQVLYSMSRELLDNANTSVDAIVRSEIAAALALEEDKVFLEGTGGQKPLGFYMNPRVESTTISTTPTFDTFKDAAIRTRYNNAEVNGWIMNPRTAHTLSKLKDGSGRYAKNMGGVPDGNFRDVNNIDGAIVKQTTQIPIVLRSAANDSYAVGGQWQYFQIGQKANIRIETSMHSSFTTDEIDLRMISFVGCLVKQPGAFVVVKGIQA